MIFAGVALAAPAALAKPAKPTPAPRKHAEETQDARPATGLTGLLNASPERVKARLGEPAISRAEGRGAFWTYRAPRCALYLFFKDEGGLKVSGAAAGPRKRGVPYPDLETCLAELEQGQLGVAAR